jgi:TolB-like protein/Flp pilus assembly protein TadD
VPGSSFFSELRRRKVLQAAAIYGAVAWGVTEVVVTVVEQLFLPQWVATLAVIGFVVGFPVAMFLAWTFDLTSEGIRRTDVTSRRGAASIGLSMALLLAGTAGLFFIIKPGLENRAPPGNVVEVPPNSLAVMPFDYSGPNPDGSYLGPGLSDELRDQLGRVSELRIAARSSSIVAVQEGTDAKATALKLGVAHLLEGTVRRRGTVLRVSVQLIDGKSGLVIWNDTFDRDRRELLNVQQDIAAAVVRTVLPGSSQPIAEPATRNATANELMLLARHYEQQVREREDVDIETLQKAVHYYRLATKADPESALAQSRLAGALLYLGDIDGAEAHASSALLLDPKLAEVQHTFGKILFARGSPNMGEPLARAVELNPNLPDAIADYAFWLWFNVGTDGVAEFFQRALDLDPLNPARYAALGSFLAMSGRPDGARALAERAQAIFNGATAYRAIAHVYDLIGEVDHAIAWTIKAREVEPDNPLHVERLAEFYTDIGDYETTTSLDPDIGVGLLLKMRRYEEMIEKAELRMIDYPEDTQLRVYLGFAYSATGQFDAAIRIITTSGVLNSYSHTRRSTEESDAFTVLLNAAYGSGEIDRARELAEWARTKHYHANWNYWWVALGRACTESVLGHDEEVRRLFRKVLASNALAWEPMLKDQQCFKRFAGDPAYLAVIKHFDDRRALLRDRLPATLAQYGVSQ